MPLFGAAVDFVLVGDDAAEQGHHLVVRFQLEHAVEHLSHLDEDLVGQGDRLERAPVRRLRPPSAPPPILAAPQVAAYVLRQFDAAAGRFVPAGGFSNPGLSMRLLVSWSPRSSNASATPAISSADWTTFCSEPATRSRRRAARVAPLSKEWERGRVGAWETTIRCPTLSRPLPLARSPPLLLRSQTRPRTRHGPADCACRSSFRKLLRTAAAAASSRRSNSASRSAGVTTSSANCWLLPARGSSERLKRSAALSDSVNRWPGRKLERPFAGCFVDDARVELVEVSRAPARRQEAVQSGRVADGPPST